MRWRLLAVISMGINLALLVAWAAMRGQPVSKSAAETPANLATMTNADTRPKVVVRRQFFSWHDIESSDYATYIANLRDIGCPEQTTRDIIIADVNALFARRLATELLTPDQQWWRTEPDPEVQQAATEKAAVIEQERRGLLASLLGSNWETGDLANLPRPSKPGVVLDGPILGILPSDVKQSVQEVNLRYEERLAAYVEKARAEGRELDPSELAKLQQQTRTELAKILAPAQLEEYLLRFSSTANDLRLGFGELQFFETTPDEFRTVFRSIDSIQQQINLLGEATDPQSVASRKNLEAQRESAIRTALGNRRYEEYRMLKDPAYRDAVALAREAGTPEAARAIYQINLAAEQEQSRILTSTNLTSEQRNIELRQLELDQLKANTLATGGELPPEPAPAPAPPPRRTYTVRPGDNAAVVSMIYGVPLNAIRAANPGVDLNRLRPGDTLNIPRSSVPPPLPQ